MTKELVASLYKVLLQQCKSLC